MRRLIASSVATTVILVPIGCPTAAHAAVPTPSITTTPAPSSPKLVPKPAPKPKAAAKPKTPAKKVVKKATKKTLPLPKACAKMKRGFCASQSQRTLWFVDGGKVRAQYDVRFGSKQHPTHNGSFRIYAKYEKYTSKLYKVSMPFSMFFDQGRAIHFAEHFVRTGYARTSHGCVNMRDWHGAKFLFSQGRRGDIVTILK